MTSIRFLSLLAIASLCFSSQLFAGQANGQLGISVTIAKHCEVVGDAQAGGLRVSGHDCGDNGFVLRDEQNRPLSAQGSSAAPSQIKVDEIEGPFVVVYW